MINARHCIEAATRACKQAGLADNQARFYALTGTAEMLLEEAEQLSLCAQYADREEYRRRDEAQAKQLRDLALDLGTEADGVDPGGPHD